MINNIIYERIKSSEINKAINAEKQSRHIRDSGGYVEGRSYLLDGVDAQALVDRYHGTGKARLNKTKTEWTSKEFVVADRDIGVSINPSTGVESLTNRFTIHYSKTGTHIVPTERGKISYETMGV